MRAMPRSSRRIAGLRASTIPTSARKAAPRKNSRRSTKPTRRCGTRRSARPTISCARAAIGRATNSAAAGFRRGGLAAGLRFRRGVRQRRRGGGDFSDFFESLFGVARGGGARRRARPRPHGRYAREAGDSAGGGLRAAAACASASRQRTLEVSSAGHPSRAGDPAGAGQGSSGARRSAARSDSRAHPHFELDGRNVLLTLPVAPWEAALGATVACRRWAGRST